MLDAPVTTRVPKATGRGAGAPVPRHDLAEDFAASRRMGADEAARERYVPRRFSGLKFRLRGGVPESIAGRVVMSGMLLAGLAGFTLGLWELRGLLLHQPLLNVRSSSSIQITGNQHMTRAQLLGVFGGDVDRNALAVPLAQRQAELERLPWVEHATVMRLLPNRFRVAIVERTPVAFVRQGGAIGLVDAQGVLLDLASDGDGAAVGKAHADYSFPVVTGIAQGNPLSTRAARMRLYLGFIAALDGGGERVSDKLSEVDLSNPEDVKALIPSGTSAILVHFGEDDFLRRYELFEKNLPEWLTQHPKLAAADMRYDHQVVLEMRPGATVEAERPAAEKVVPVVKTPAVGKVKSAVAKPVTISPDPTHRKGRDEWGTPGAAAPSSVAAPGQAAAKGHLQTSFDVKTKAVPAKTTSGTVPQ